MSSSAFDVKSLIGGLQDIERFKSTSILSEKNPRSAETHFKDCTT
jgi:hypothetical protein